MSIRVLLADDHAAIRAGLAMILDHADGIEVVAEAGDGAAAVRKAEALRPDLVLMDVRMPGVDGIEATRRLVDSGVCPVLVLTTFDMDEYVYGARRAGAAGFLLKTADGPTLTDAVRRVAAGGIDEVVLAMNATLEGQTTAHYITDRLEGLPIRLTQLAHGLPVGGELDYLDEGTLAQALRARRPVG